jgi:ribosomal peptide maturation radical SAM protein 1
MIQLVNMPFGSIMRAPIALGLIKAQLRAAGVAARTHNLNFGFAHALGFGAYEMIARFKGVETQISEWLFAEAAWRRPFGPDPDEFLRTCGDELETIPNVPDVGPWLLHLRRDVVPPYLDQCYRRLVAEGPPRVVAFSCMFFQTIAALALGRMIKERHPETRVIFGGACFHGDAGEELFEKLPWIDAVATGEADDVIVPLFQALERGETPELAGIRARAPDGRVVVGAPPVAMSDAVLEQLPDPDYDEFFEDAARVGLTDHPVWQERASLPFEASRGCWWGQKKHCTFCGLNGEGIGFRAKSADVVLATLERLAARYPVKHLQATDNIMAMSYWKTFLPRLAAAPLRSSRGRVELFFEIKPNLTRAQIKALGDANVRYVQPGIESLSSHLLEVIDKGVSALQNVFLVKCATEYGLLPIWNLLVRLPRERAEDYAAMAAWIPKLVHLRPPTGGAPRVECHRYSPYFFRTGEYVEELRPARWYRGIYPEDEIDLGRVAYYFDVTWRDTLGDPAYDEVTRLAREWMDRWRAPEVPRLTMHAVPDDMLVIEDTRGTEPVRWQLSALDSWVVLAIRDIATPARVAAQLPASVTHDERAIRAALEGLVERGLAIREGERFLGLPLPPGDPAPLEERHVQMRRVTNQRPSSLTVVT